MPQPLKLILVAGARPNFMKVAPLIHAIRRHNAAAGSSSALPPPPSVLRPLSSDLCPPSSDLRPLTSDLCPLTPVLVHTGQHYDDAMSEVFFRELGIPKPDVNLGVGSGSHAVQTAAVMVGFEKVCLAEKPDWVVVFGDVNSTVACTLVAVKLGIRVAHVEAGLRSGDRTMPEEINRIVTDSIADLLLTPSADGNENLRREGVPGARIRLVGNIMIDSLVANLEQARRSSILQQCGVQPGKFLYVTLHRPANVDDRASLTSIAGALKRLAATTPVVFPVHPRTRKMFSEFGIQMNGDSGCRLLDPVGYHDSVCLTENARLVLTDSGGLQEESTYFRTPCLTLRPNTERPVTITVGSNRLTQVSTLAQDLDDVLAAGPRLGRLPDLWDGHTAERIIKTLLTL
jgi:UDP-N-acetylglucosamine 2-epimerase (non-hydrolysing)